MLSFNAEKLTQEVISRAFKRKETEEGDGLSPWARTIVGKLHENLKFSTVLMQAAMAMVQDKEDMSAAMAALLSMGIVVGIRMAEEQAEVEELERIGGN